MLSWFVRWPFKVIHPIYYRYLFGSEKPLALRLRGWIHRCEMKSGRGDVPQSKETWESEYRGGNWSFLKSADEVARYSVIAGFQDYFGAGGSVLDVGCGEGLLATRLAPGGFSRYTGIDLSQAAVAEASPMGSETVEFLAADAETYIPSERYDVIVFNESLYYFLDPVFQVRRYQEHLKADGAVIVSMWGSPRTRAIAGQLRRKSHVAESVILSHEKGSWQLMVLRPLEQPDD